MEKTMSILSAISQCMTHKTRVSLKVQIDGIDKISDDGLERLACEYALLWSNIMDGNVQIYGVVSHDVFDTFP